MAEKVGLDQRTIRGPDSELAAVIYRSCGSIRKIRRLFIQRASFVGNRPTAEKIGKVGAERPAVTIIKTFGSIRTIPTSFSSAPTRARSSPRTAARVGARGTTNRPRSCITSAPTIRFRIDFTAGNRKVAQLESRAVAMRARSRFAIGNRSRLRNTVTSLPTRSIPKLSSAEN